MTALTTPRTLLDGQPLSVRAKLTAAWTSFVFLYVYVDILNFYKPGVIAGITDGLIWRFDISATLLTIFLASVSIPAVMVVLSMTLPARVNRSLNLVVASLLIPYSIFNEAGSTWEWAAFYAISIAIELLILAFILRTAWAWPRAALTTGPGSTPDLAETLRR
jgi:phage shock protein PspC (stress-responsive transcriptional regulator)